jgi:cyanophycin synthetase
VLNVQSDHLGLTGVDTLEQLALVKRIVVEVARDTAVLNADDPLCLRMAEHTTATHLCYVTMNPEHTLVREHIRAGGRGVVLERGITGQMITIYDHGTHIPLLWAHLVPATLDGRATHNVQNALFAAAVAFCMGLRLEDIRHGLRTFDTTFFQAPGRMNVYDEHPFKVILDYGHNPTAVELMCSLAERLKPRRVDGDGSGGRRLLVLSAPGDRRDEDIREIARVAAGRFDHYVCRRDDSRRGRKSDEVPRMLEASLLESGVPAERITVIPDEQEATQAALRMARPGDLLLVFVDNAARSWKQVVEFQPELPEQGTVERPPAEPRVAPEPAAGQGETLVRAARGVWLATEDGSD